ncbi:hypothetical protein RHMOL_Rhmol11G0027900 [Rhododendron molle]|uniref:Uncharacterized protein n=1 Tax=Rhododendron molle TaxID=49168 RepID=A0ACC0LN89_RHOML|nr:hypothetical protein RHMOL_Rhmol11G0027900 [Rhododendron molle]
MGRDLTEVTILGAKDASGNIILPASERHMSISIPASFGLSPATEETPPPPPPPSPPERQHETGQRGSVKDRLGFTPTPGDAREIILYKQPTASGTHRSRSHHERTKIRDTGSFTSPYLTGRAEFSCTTVSHRSRDFVQTRRHVSERLGDIPPENFDNEYHGRRKGKGVRIDGALDDNKAHLDREKSIDSPRRKTLDLRDKLRRRDGEKALAKKPKERDSKRTKTDEHGKPPRPGFERQLKDLGVSPFTSHIINTPPESTFHLPKFTKFDPATYEAYTHLITSAKPLNSVLKRMKLNARHSHPASAPLDSSGSTSCPLDPFGTLSTLNAHSIPASSPATRLPKGLNPYPR